jgi:manganese transport protein
VVIVTLVGALLLVQSSINPIKLTEFSIVLVAVAAPLTYLPILLLANDPRYVGDKTNSRATNTAATVLFALMVVAAIAAIPLLLITKGGA